SIFCGVGGAATADADIALTTRMMIRARTLPNHWERPRGQAFDVAVQVLWAVPLESRSNRSAFLLSGPEAPACSRPFHSVSGLPASLHNRPSNRELPQAPAGQPAPRAR